MELTPTQNVNEYKNGHGDTIFFKENEFLYPLLKSSDIKKDHINKTRKFVIVTQRKPKSDTSIIKDISIEVWEYLNANKTFLQNRKSSIYKNAPDFSIFGVGDYSFSKYKVGVSGFYKEPQFSLISADRPIMLDDTCYFLSFDSLEVAAIVTALLNSDECKKFLKSIAFLESKRPYTKEVLKRISIRKLFDMKGFDYVTKYCKRLNIEVQTNFDSLLVD